MLYLSDENTRVASVQCCGRYQYPGRFWKEGVLKFLLDVYRETELPELVFGLEGPGGVTITLPLDLEEMTCCEGAINERPDWIDRVPTRDIIKSSGNGLMILANLPRFTHSKRRLLVVDFGGRRSQLGSGSPTKIKTLYVWKTNKVQLDMAGDIA